MASRGGPEEATVSEEARARIRQAGAGIGLLLLAASAAYGGDLFGMRTRLLGTAPPEARPPAVSRVADLPAPLDTPTPTRVRSYPWWQELDTFEGTGDGEVGPLAVDEDAIQWRVLATCQQGRIVVRPAGGEALVDAACPDGGSGFATSTGPTRLTVEASGAWQLVVEQQLDVPLIEPPLQAMTAPGATVLTTGTFYDIDQTGRGEVDVYRLPDGSHALRLTEFFVTPNVDLEIRLSPLERPRTTAEFKAAPSVLVAPLPVTAGSMNFSVPADVDPGDHRSVVIWCPPLDIAYAGATLEVAQ